MNVLSFVPNLVGGGLEEHKCVSKRSQRIHRENERANMLSITHLVLNSFLDDAIRGNRILEAETREISDLLVMIEKILWHGFQNPTILSLRKPETEMWSFIEAVGKRRNQEDVSDTWKTVTESSNLNTCISKFRAFWRLSITQKKLADYFQAIVDSDLVCEYYEPWALLRSDKCSMLAGAFLALGVFDCNLILEYDQLQEQVCSFDISPYLKLPTLLGHMPQWCKDYAKEEAQSDLKVILDQKQYLEERNRQLGETIENLKKKLRVKLECRGKISSGSLESEDKSLIFTQRLGDLEREREILQARLAERDDAVRLSQQQLADTKHLNEDLYEKLRAAEGLTKRLQRDIQSLQDSHAHEMAELNRCLESFRRYRTASEKEEVQNGSSNNGEDDPSDLLCDELANKTQQYMEMISIVNEKQQELSKEVENSSRLERRCNDLEKKIARMVDVEQELAEMTTKYAKTMEQLSSCQQALEELGGHLSESKLKIIELREEIQPLSEAAWVKDAEVKECKLCESPFSVTQRRHHCRSCGCIFCHHCSSARVKLPSSAKPVRVCLFCYEALSNRNKTDSTSS